MPYEFETSLTYPAPGATPETAPTVIAGGQVSGVSYATVDQSAKYQTYNHPNAHAGNVGWYKFVPTLTGMARLSSNHGMIQVFKAEQDPKAIDGLILVGARYNGGSVYLFCDFEANRTYYIRFASGVQSTLNWALSKVSPVVHTFQSFTNPRLSTAGVHGNLAGAVSATLDWESEISSHPYRYAYAKNLLVDLPAIPIPDEAVDETDAGIADIRYVITAGTPTIGGAQPTSTGPAFLIIGQSGSWQTYWTHDWLWNWNWTHERWISLRTSNSSFAVPPSNLINGTQKGWEGPNFDQLAIGRMLDGVEGERAVVDIPFTGVRMSWFAATPNALIVPGVLNTRQHFFEGRDA